MHVTGRQGERATRVERLLDPLLFRDLPPGKQAGPPAGREGVPHPFSSSAPLLERVAEARDHGRQQGGHPHRPLERWEPGEHG
ncbi:hypothetical protein D187_008864 [Cystobacter fuscus DSM 2262]|uniref:Uncharacterized protein n=1 Tax=Cystobacter fuscus (strain ATCC 25194 / DSM 2262 / NBRC 100088 / M29) TaxID=1242864 RepID=S9PHZ9_CYSF2|nr:hypothetical protein D187_008864 [Cystobacter fuscus DSM 2262]